MELAELVIDSDPGDPLFPNGTTTTSSGGHAQQARDLHPVIVAIAE